MLSVETAKEMTVAELRSYARSHRFLVDGMSGRQIADASKSVLINLLAKTPSNPLFKESVKTQKTTPTSQKSNVASENSNVAPKSDGLADILANALQGKIGIDEAAIHAIIDERLANYRPTGNIITIENIETNTTTNIGLQHKAFAQILKLAQLRINTMLVGPAGSGKTTVCANVAKALDLNFETMSVCMQTTKSDLLGYIDANSNYVSTRLRECYESGGVFLLDEIDSGNPNVLTVINALSENGHGPFPDKTIPRHPDFILIAAANTFGLGGNIEYVGRNPIDAATRDRFAMVHFDYDENLERTLANNDQWTDRVQLIRKTIIDMREKNVLATPRATIKGAGMLAAGFDQKEVEDMMIFKGINPEIKDRILGRL